MKSERPPCDRELLCQSLDDSLSELQEDALAHHLTNCVACQRELERLAAEQTEWSRVSDILKQEAQSSRSAATGEWPTGSQAPWHCGGDSQLAPLDGRDVSIADFAVDFLDPSPTPQSLGQLGDIDIHEVIGHGGMGIVLRGFQRELNRPVAVKVLAPHLATSGAARKRFAREAQATAVIVHPNVMPILTVDSSGKLPHLVMPYVACESLQQRVDRGGPLATIDVLRIAKQVASGLAAAHAQGLVHRDIKPANVLLEKGVDRAMLTDFGLARAVDDATLTRTGVIAGTPQFMAPEQARGESVDARSDLFSLGSVMYTMCTGRPPFRAETSYGILRRITDTDPRPIREINSELPEWLVAIIRRLHAKDPAERFQSAGELAELLEACIAHVQQPTVVPLPESVQSLVRQAFPCTKDSRTARCQRALVTRTLAACSTITAFGQAVLRSRIALASGIVAGVLTVAAVVGIAIRNHPKDDSARTSPSIAPTSVTVPAESTPAADRDSASATWRDGTAEQIHELENRVEQLELKTARFWDDNTSPSASPSVSNNSPKPIQPSDQESNR